MIKWQSTSVCFTVMHRVCTFYVELFAYQTGTNPSGWYCPLQTTSNIDYNNNNKGIYHLLIVSAAVLFLLLRSLCYYSAWHGKNWLLEFYNRRNRTWREMIQVHWKLFERKLWKILNLLQLTSVIFYYLIGMDSSFYSEANY